MMTLFNQFKSSKKKDKEFSLTAQDDTGQGTYTVKISQSILIEHSQLFHDMTKLELKKARKTKLEGVTILALKKIVVHMQNGEVDFQNHVEALETLRAAEKYKIQILQKICVNHLITTLEPSNVCEIFETALSLSLRHLQYYCLTHIDEHAADVLTSRGFVMLQKSTVREIIRRHSLNINSEKAVFDAVLGWGLNDTLEIDPNNPEEIMRSIKSLLPHVRFSSMSQTELDDPELSKYHTLMTLDGPWNRERTISGDSDLSTGTAESLLSQPRQHLSHYVVGLSVYEDVLHTIKNGETYCLRIEILKGTVFLTGVNLALRAFAQTKDTACLYVVVTATNILSMEQTTKRGAFLNTSEKASLVFPTPLVAKESERIEIALSAKRAENICPYATRNDVQIVMPECQTVAMKITLPEDKIGAEEPGRCIFKEIEYFF